MREGDGRPDEGAVAAASAPTPRRRALRQVLRLVVCVVAAGVLGAPLAVSWAVTHTEVTEQVGTSPTTFTLSTQGHSELRLGIAGTVFVPDSRGPLGIVATVQGPGDPGTGGGDLAGYVRPEMLQLYAGLFHDPQAAVEGYVTRVTDELEHQLVRSFVLVAVVGGGAVFVITTLLPMRLRGRGWRDAARLGVTGVVVLSMTTGVAAMQLRGAPGGRGPTEGTYALLADGDGFAAGASTDSPVIRALAGGAVDRARTLVERQEEAQEGYLAEAAAALDADADLLAGPDEGEVAVMMQSDMHCNTTMIALQRQVMAMLRRAGSGPSLLAIAGDLTTNGTAAEGRCIEDIADVARLPDPEVAGTEDADTETVESDEDLAGEDPPVAAITGNHESDTSAEQMAAAGMTVLDGELVDVGGLRVLGDGDPARSELFGATRLRGEETQEGQGERLRVVAEDSADDDEQPDLVLVHEAYAAQAFLGIESVDAVVRNSPPAPSTPSLTTPPADPDDDGVGDVPAGAVFYGHWHRDHPPRVLWNSDGTWTFLMELDTSGGAVATPTITNFSTPWSQPRQQASFPVLFLDEETRLVTGYQLYRFDPDGVVTVEPRVDVGAPAALGAAGDAS